MKLRHYTTEKCAESIAVQGLDPARSGGKEACVWLVDEFAAWKLVRHLEALRGHPPGGWVVFVVDVPDEWLVKTGIPGRWKCYRLIPPFRLRSLRLERRRKADRRKASERTLPFVRPRTGRRGPPAA